MWKQHFKASSANSRIKVKVIQLMEPVKHKRTYERKDFMISRRRMDKQIKDPVPVLINIIAKHMIHKGKCMKASLEKKGHQPFSERKYFEVVGSDLTYIISNS